VVPVAKGFADVRELLNSEAAFVLPLAMMETFALPRLVHQMLTPLDVPTLPESVTIITNAPPTLAILQAPLVFTPPETFLLSAMMAMLALFLVAIQLQAALTLSWPVTITMLAPLIHATPILVAFIPPLPATNALALDLRLFANKLTASEMNAIPIMAIANLLQLFVTITLPAQPMPATQQLATVSLLLLLRRQQQMHR